MISVTQARIVFSLGWIMLTYMFFNVALSFGFVITKPISNMQTILESIFFLSLLLGSFFIWFTISDCLCLAWHKKHIFLWELKF